MFQNVPHQIVPSPARLGLSNPNSPALQSPSPAASKPTSQPSHQPNQQQQITLITPKITSATLLALLPPLPRAQTLLLQMGSLATKLFDVSPNRASWLSAFRGSFPTFLSSQIQSTSVPTVDSSVSNTKELISLFTSLQTQLFEAVSELQEILDLEDSKQKLNHEIEMKDASILSFTKKLHEAERVLDILVDDYADYRRPKRSKSEDTDDSSTTTVATQLKLLDVISYAHKISYTTFAPPEFGAGGPLRGALPPAPQEDQMRASQLYTFADLDVGLPKMAEDKEGAIEPLMEIPTIPVHDPMGLPPNFPLSVPAGWQPGMPVELPRDLPLPPPGWKPGDPIPLPPFESAPSLSPNNVHQQPQQPRPPVPAPSRASEVVHVNPIDINILGDDSSDEYSSSSEEISDDED